jgi:hypothetical protein
MEVYMEMKKHYGVFKKGLLFVAIGLFLVAIGLFAGLIPVREQTRISIPENMERTALAEILNNPNNYDGRRVLLVGIVGIGCLACPDKFPYQEGVNTIQMSVGGFRKPRLRRGQPVRVYAEVKAGKERALITALAMEVR